MNLVRMHRIPNAKIADEPNSYAASGISVSWHIRAESSTEENLFRMEFRLFLFLVLSISIRLRFFRFFLLLRLFAIIIFSFF